jgi:hypothetical protein
VASVVACFGLIDLGWSFDPDHGYGHSVGVLQVSQELHQALFVPPQRKRIDAIFLEFE